MSPLQTRPSPGRQIVLVGFPAHDGAGGPVPRALSAALAQEGFARADLVVYRSLDSPQCQGYLLPAPDRRSVTDEAYWRLREALAAGLPSADVARLVALMEIEGASVSAVPTHHYVVETDVVETAEADLNDWYDQEHMPGLAAVEGTVRAARYRNLDKVDVEALIAAHVEGRTWGILGQPRVNVLLLNLGLDEMVAGEKR